MRSTFLFLLVIVCEITSAQLVGTGIGSSNPTTRRMEVYSWAQRPDDDGTDLQKKFLKQEWTDGLVKFRSGRPDMHLPLLFDVFDNTLYYLQDSVIMEFVDSVSEVIFTTYFNTDTVQMLFRRFYPPVQANTGATFYQVLLEARIPLLKCQAKSILLFKEPDKPESRREDPPEALYFVQLPDGSMVEVEPNTQDLLKKLPQLSGEIKGILQREKLKVKDEKKLVELFIHLNNLEQ